MYLITNFNRKSLLHWKLQWVDNQCQVLMVTQHNDIDWKLKHASLSQNIF